MSPDRIRAVGTTLQIWIPWEQQRYLKMRKPVGGLRAYSNWITSGCDYHSSNSRTEDRHFWVWNMYSNSLRPISTQRQQYAWWIKPYWSPSQNRASWEMGSGLFILRQTNSLKNHSFLVWNEFAYNEEWYLEEEDLLTRMSKLEGFSSQRKTEEESQPRKMMKL